MPRDMQGHRQRCPGRGPAHRLDAWENERTTAARRLPKDKLDALVRSGVVRSRHESGKRELLTRDVEQMAQALELYGSDG